VFSHFYWSKKRNILQGFDATDNSGAKDIKGSNRDIAAPRVFARYQARLGELQKQSSPWFLFVHYFEPHSTYLRHKPPHDFGNGWMDKYDGEIHFVDAWVGKTLEVLDSSPAKDRTIVVLTSDHGEGNGEHGFKWHGQHIYDEVLHVPLLVRGPGIAPRTVDVPVALMDIAPTLVELAGGEPPPEFEGRSLAGALRGEPLAVSPLRAELVPYPGWQEHIQAVVDFPLKLVRNRTKNTWELFDLSVDPREQSNLYRKRTEDAKRMRRLLVTPAAAGPG
jgi:arylsulfatase A-like enzyme